MSDVGYRGGYSIFHDTVRELVERGVFDASEVTDYKSEAPAAKLDEFITLFPVRGYFKGCRAERLEGCLFSVFQESDRGQYLEKLEFVRGENLPDEFICEIDFQEFTYARFDTSQFSRKKDSGRIRRPDKREEDNAQLERKAKREKHPSPGDSTSTGGAQPSASTSSGRSGDNQRRRTFLNLKTKEQQPGQLSGNTNGEGGGRLGLPKIDKAGGQGRLSHIRYRDDWKANLWQPGLPDSQLRSGPCGEGDQSGHKEYVTRAGRKISLRLPQSNI